MKLIFIHGIAQSGKKADALRDDWVSDLKQSGVEAAALAAAKPVMAFYAKELADGRGAFGLASADFLNLERLKFLNAVKNDIDLAARKAVKNAFDAGHFLSQGENLAKVATNLLASNQPFGVRNALGIADEIFDYLTKSTLRQAIDAKVAASLVDEPMTIVAHSLGTLVAYRLLRDKQIPCRRLITLGSPLSISVVKDRLDGAYSYPKGLQDWRNFYDPVDLVSLGKAFRGGPTWPHRLEHIMVDNKALFGHDADGYLRTPEVARSVQEALNG
jgi:pimeloyl-ACP methyl ester carboxylesterase